MTGLVTVCGAASAGLPDDWSDLFERCRVSVEQGVPFEARGLERAPEEERLGMASAARTVKAGNRIHKLPAIKAPDALWHVPGGRFSVAITESNCTVRQRAGQRLSVDEKQDLIARFKEDRDALVAAGSHEMRIVQPGRPVQQFAFRPLRRMADGKCVISTISWTLKWLAGGTGVQPDRLCDLPER
ncbi:hypothetical protein [Salipiger abyssi]|uniref:hypothetical protein n=1 Tax=Salipiger abyssi TaxID=1250539 RepID=UPI001A8C501D|nr:hypothetical protein [Salipiger abyssi]MBN9886798.1 hypothetical protein [Salipiger abyssi]